MASFFSVHKRKFSWIPAVVFILFFCLVYKKILEHPNQFLVAGGDGMKNYYTFMYHVAHDSSAMVFEGMNYPFGENIVFTDNQPLLANAVRWVSGMAPAIRCYLPAVHNLALLAGLILGAFGFYLCLRKRRVATGFALVATLGLMLMHPQADRIHGHFAMFYPVLPWLFLIWLTILEKGLRWQYDVVVGALILLSGLLHMYFFITGAMLSVLAIALMWLWSPLRPSAVALVRSMAIQVVVPFAVLYSVTSFFHPATDRPADPWGFFSYHSYWEGLFFSYRLPLYKLIHQYIIPIRDFDVEGKYYLGILAVVFLLWQMIRGLKTVGSALWSRLRHRLPGVISWPEANERILWGIAILSALISFGYPFTISGLEGLLEYTGPFRQFRSIGRVAWITFYAVNLLAIPGLYLWWKQLGEGPKKSILYYALPGIALVEGAMFYAEKPIQQTELPAYYCTDAFEKLPVEAGDYQALLPDPYFSVGSEGFAWWEQGQNVNQNFMLSYRLALPTLGTNLSRTSHKEAFLLNELVCKPYRVPEVIRLIASRDTRPLLVVETKGEVHEHRCRLSHWTGQAPVVYENDQFRLRRLELSAFDTLVRVFRDSVDRLPPPVTRPFSFVKAKGPKGWGYEAYLQPDSTLAGQRTIGYWIEAVQAGQVHVITEVWQYDANHNQLDYLGEANRFNYKRMEGNRLWIETPVKFRSDASKIVLRVSKDQMKEQEELRITGQEIILR